MLRRLVLSILFTGIIAASQTCEQCLSAGKHWCATVNKCDFSPCPTTISKPLNCPRPIDPKYAYDDTVARTQWLPLFGISYGDQAQKCFDNNWPTMKLYNRLLVNCSDPSPTLPQTQCAMLTAVDKVKKVLVMSFRGTDGNTQLAEEILDYFTGKKQFFDAGYIFEFFYDAFLFLWKGGLETDIRNLKYLYPDYQLWVTGHSLGGALASVGASYVVKIGLFKPENVRLLTAGQPRTGDYNYSMWHQNTFPYSYRVVHHKDVVPHVPFQYELDHDKMYHHRTEIWYNNDMSVGSEYHVCAEADGLYCSNKQADMSWNDHMHYYNIDLDTYGDNGCPKQ